MTVASVTLDIEGIPRLNGTQIPGSDTWVFPPVGDSPDGYYICTFIATNDIGMTSERSAVVYLRDGRLVCLKWYDNSLDVVAIEDRFLTMYVDDGFRVYYIFKTCNGIAKKERHMIRFISGENKLLEFELGYKDNLPIQSATGTYVITKNGTTVQSGSLTFDSTTQKMTTPLISLTDRGAYLINLTFLIGGQTRKAGFPIEVVA